jgi:cyanate permease
MIQQDPAAIVMVVVSMRAFIIAAPKLQHTTGTRWTNHLLGWRAMSDVSWLMWWWKEGQSRMNELGEAVHEQAPEAQLVREDGEKGESSVRKKKIGTFWSGFFS